MTDDPDDKTPPATPFAKKSSGSLPAMRPCPQCSTVGVVEVDGHWRTCPLCGGDMHVSHFKLVEWELHRGHEDFAKLADSSEPPPPEKK